MSLTENQRQWFADLMDGAIADARGAAKNEHIWALGADTNEASGQHEANSEENKDYAEFLEAVKEEKLGTV